MFVRSSATFWRPLRPLALMMPLLAAPLASAQPTNQAATPSANPAASVAGADTARAQDRWYFQTSVYTRHFRPDERHDNSQQLINLEYWRSDRYLAGLALFDNSFGQPSQYVYLGRTWQVFDAHPNVHLKLTAGLLHGYKDEFKNKIPFNRFGVAPAIVPSIGYSWGRLNTELVLFGAAGIMLTAGFFF